LRLKSRGAVHHGHERRSSLDLGGLAASMPPIEHDQEKWEPVFIKKIVRMHIKERGRFRAAHLALARDQVKHGLAKAGLESGLPSDRATKQRLYSGPRR
jgi:hypothetical protein